MKRIALWLLVVACLALWIATSRAASGVEGVYIGTLGGIPVVVNLENADGDGTYFYRRVGRDIILQGKQNDGVLALTETDAYATERARLELKQNANGFNGTWSDLKKSRVLPVTLRRVTSGDLSALKFPVTPEFRRWQQESPFDALRFDQPFKPSSTVNVSGKRVQWLIEPKSGVRFPRLPDMNLSVNTALSVEHYRIAANALQCPLEKPDGFTYTPSLSLYSSRLFSVNASVDYYCGGAHPDNYEENTTLDLRTAKILRLEDLYRFVGGAVPVIQEKDYSPAQDVYDKARAAKLVALILKQYGTLTKGVDKECKMVYDQEEGNGLAYLTWYLTAKGLVVQSSFAHVAATCENSYTLPYSVLKPYLAPNSPLR